MAASEPSESANRTTWHNSDSPLRLFLRTETGSAAILLAAAIVALVWANTDLSSYTRLWSTQFTIRLGDVAVSMDLQGWVNSGLMTFFFLVIGLEARREFDLGEFRDRRRFILPVIAGLGGMVGAIGLYVAINAGRSSAHGWGVAMSTDTAFALGVLALMGDRVPDRLRGFILTVTVVDDIVGLVVIAVVYSTGVTVPPLFVAVAVFAGVLVAARLHVHNGLVYFVLGATCWVAVFKSGIDPIVVGLAMGLVAYAAPVTRSDLERVSNLYRQFREQPTVELAQSARSGLRMALSPNDRLQRIYHPWASYLIVPLFGLANAGIPIDPQTLLRGYTSPITLGIVVGYVVGKPVGIALMSAVVVRVTKGRLRPPVGWAAIVGGGTIAGVGFTVSLLVATVAFRGVELQEAKLGVLTAAVVSAVLTWSIFFVTKRSARLSARGLLGGSEVIVDLADDVDPEHDHIRGPADAPVTLLEYGDFECPYCGRAEGAVRELLAEFGDLRYVWRHLPLNDVHPQAQLAAEASEAAEAQGAFWPMHDLLFENQDELEPEALVQYARQLGMDADRFLKDLQGRRWEKHVGADVESADASGVAGTPSFFVNGQRQTGAFDLEALARAVQSARARAPRK